MASVKFQIQEANPEFHSKDLECLIHELAEFERMPSGPQLNAEQLKNDLCQKKFHAFVAVLNEKYDQWSSNSVIGLLIYYYAYSTWQGQYMFIEDIYVKPAFRRCGIGSALWNTAAKLAHDQQLPRIEWNVLEWNEAAIQFYNRIGGIDLHKTESWIRFRLDRTRIRILAETSDTSITESICN